MNAYCRIATASMIALSSTLAVSPAQAIDYKAINAVTCLPYGPNTTLSELTYNQKGITNPGTTNESVLCSVTSDAQVSYTTTPGESAQLNAFFQAGAIPGRAACTVWVSNSSMVSGPVYSMTLNPANSAAGERGYLVFDLADTSGIWGVAPPMWRYARLPRKRL